MSDIAVSVELATTPKAVWAYVKNIGQHVEWMADAETIRFETEQTSGIGTKFLCDTKIGPIKLVDKMEITAWTPVGEALNTCGLIGVTHTGIVTGAGEFTIQPLGGGSGCKFTWSETLSFPWFLGGRLGALVGGRLILGRVWKRNLRSLKQIVERPATEGSAPAE